MPGLCGPSNVLLKARLMETLRGNISFVRHLRVLGLISYSVDDDPEEKFIKIDFVCDVDERESQSDLIKPLADQDCLVSTNCPTPGSAGDLQASNSSSSSETEGNQVIHSSPTISILSTLSSKPRCRPFLRYSELNPNSAAVQQEIETVSYSPTWHNYNDSCSQPKSRRDRRKCRKPRRQCLQSVEENQTCTTNPASNSNKRSLSPIELYPEDMKLSPSSQENLNEDLSLFNTKDYCNIPSDSSLHNKSSSSPSSGCQLDTNEDDMDTAPLTIATTSPIDDPPACNKVIASTATLPLANGLALFNQNTYSLLLRGPFTFSTSSVASTPLQEVTSFVPTTQATSLTKEAPKETVQIQSHHKPQEIRSSVEHLPLVSNGSSNKGAYKCRYCDKLFNRKFCRERHERLHTGVKPYTCEVCAEKFIRLEDKKRHLRLIHPGSSLDPENTSPFTTSEDC